MVKPALSRFRRSIVPASPRIIPFMFNYLQIAHFLSPLPDRLPVPRTCIRRTIGANVSLEQTFYGSPFLLFSCVGGCDG